MSEYRTFFDLGTDVTAPQVIGQDLLVRCVHCNQPLQIRLAPGWRNNDVIAEHYRAYADHLTREFHLIADDIRAQYGHDPAALVQSARILAMLLRLKAEIGKFKS